MEIIHRINDLQTAGLSILRTQNKKIGFVPTMGALHEGHISIVRRSVKENDATVVSIFVNPTQFNHTNDLLTYPRTLDADCKQLEAAGVSFVFAPAVEEMYPHPDTRQFAYPPLDTVMEGAFRPGHFNGVCQIVSKLFDAVQPHRAYFGEKDFQQLAIIREMTRRLKYDIEIIACPIVREQDGLAMSSRNTRLSPSGRKDAPEIYRILSESRTYALSHSASETRQFVADHIKRIPSLRLEYFQIVNGNTLQNVESWNEVAYTVGCIAVFCGEIRLIDNIPYKESST
jgi:pantoate--beta-alanine ligase